MLKSKKKAIVFYVAVFVITTAIAYMIRMNMNPSASSSAYAAGSEFGQSLWIATVVTFAVWVVKKIVYSI